MRVNILSRSIVLDDEGLGFSSPINLEVGCAIEVVVVLDVLVISSHSADS